MASADLFLYRKDRRWQKVTKVVEVTLTGSQTAYSSVSGVAATDIITVTGATLSDGQVLTFTQLTGGAGLSTGVGYYLVSTSGATGQLSATPGGAAIDFTTTITGGSVVVSAQPDFRVWSAEYRDIFPSTSVDPTYGTYFIVGVPNYFNSGGTAQNYYPTEGTAPPTSAATSAGVSKHSDEVAHAPLRQSLIARTFWKFDRGASVSPRYLYAEYQQGDQVLDTPPETV